MDREWPAEEKTSASGCECDVFRVVHHVLETTSLTLCFILPDGGDSTCTHLLLTLEQNFTSSIVKTPDSRSEGWPDWI